MALPTTVNQSLSDALRSTAEHKSVEMIGRIKLIKDICSYLSGEPTITAKRLLDLQGSLFAHKSYIVTRNLNTGASRTAIASAYPQYADAAAVQADVIAANSAFNSLTAEIETVISNERAGGQLVDTDPATGAPVERVISESNLTALRAFASTVQASLG